MSSIYLSASDLIIRNSIYVWVNVRNAHLLTSLNKHVSELPGDTCDTASGPLFYFSDSRGPIVSSHGIIPSSLICPSHCGNLKSIQHFQHCLNCKAAHEVTLESQLWLEFADELSTYYFSFTCSSLVLQAPSRPRSAAEETICQLFLWEGQGWSWIWKGAFNVNLWRILQSYISTADMTMF